MTYTLHLGDCLDILPTLPAQSVDLAFTSPPYFNAREYSQYESYSAYLDFLRAVFVQLRRVLKPARIFVLNVSCVLQQRLSRAHESVRYPIPFDCVGLARDAGFKFIDDIIWRKPDGASNRAIKFSHHRRPVAYKPFTVTEYILVFKRDDSMLLDAVIRSHDEKAIQESLVCDGYERTNVWSISPAHTSGHPAPFPLALAERVIRYYSFVGDTVLDCFMGSGTTGNASQELGRNFIGIEKDANYYNIARKRIEQVQPALMEAAD